MVQVLKSVLRMWRLSAAVTTVIAAMLLAPGASSAATRVVPLADAYGTEWYVACTGESFTLTSGWARFTDHGDVTTVTIVGEGIDANGDHWLIRDAEAPSGLALIPPDAGVIVFVKVGVGAVQINAAVFGPDGSLVLDNLQCP
jgi:hypothetical protein